jgi:hypothetical protein
VNTSVTATAMPNENEKIIYQYKLLKRIRPHPFYNLLYIATTLLWLISIELLGHTVVWVSAVTALAGWQLLSLGLTVAVISHDPEFIMYRGRHGWIARLPWIGFYPISTIPYRLFRRVTVHLMLVGAVIAGMISVWLPAEAALTIIFLHVWLTLPRLVILLRMNRAARDGAIISFQPTDVGLYSA